MALGFCQQAELGEATVARALTLALNVIPADMACLESCGIGDGGRTLRRWHRPQELTLQGANARATHQAVLGVAQGRVVGQAFQFERPAQLGGNPRARPPTLDSQCERTAATPGRQTAELA